MSKSDNRTFLLGSVGIRSDGAMVKSLNSPTEIPNRKTHSEYRLSKKLDYNSIVYVARVRLADGKFAMARPCVSCQKVLCSKRVSKVYYTISECEWGLWIPSQNKDFYYYDNLF